MGFKVVLCLGMLLSEVLEPEAQGSTYLIVMHWGPQSPYCRKYYKAQAFPVQVHGHLALEP